MPKFIVFHRDGDRWPGRPIGGMVTAAGSYRTFDEAKHHAVASERAETGESPGNRYGVWDAMKQVWWPSTRNHAGPRGRVENEYGLTFEEWLAAAGGRAHVEAVAAFGTTPRKAWRGGEDPTEYRAADAERISAIKARRNAAGGMRYRVIRATHEGGRATSKNGVTVGVYPTKEMAEEWADRVRRSFHGQMHVRVVPIAGAANRAKRAESDPEVYLSRSATPLHPEGQYRVIQGGVPISPDKATAEEALAVARHYKLKVSDRMWDGDVGQWIPLMGRTPGVTPSLWPSRSANRARSPARSRLGKRALPKSSEERVASLRDLGGYDAGAFYSVKGGRVYRRYRRAGRGLGKGVLVGTLPGYQKGMFYFVREGVVYARARSGAAASRPRKNRADGIPTQAEYERRERAIFANDLRQVERDWKTTPRDERAKEEETLRSVMADDPSLFAERTGWLLDGTYGAGARQQALAVAENKRMNRQAWFSHTIAALDFRVPLDGATRAWGRLTTEQQRALDRAITRAIEERV